MSAAKQKKYALELFFCTCVLLTMLMLLLPMIGGVVFEVDVGAKVEHCEVVDRATARSEAARVGALHGVDASSLASQLEYAFREHLRSGDWATPTSSVVQTPFVKAFSLVPAACGVAEDRREDLQFFEQAATEGFWSRRLRIAGPHSHYSYGQPSGWPEKHLLRSASGTGSNVAQARFALELLVSTIREFGVTSLLDIGCGDTNWQFEAWETDSLAAYAGLDLSPTIVQHDARRWAHHSNKVFAQWDAGRCRLPQLQWERSAGRRSGDEGSAVPESASAFELVIVKDAIQHMPLKEGIALLDDIVDSGARLFVGSTHNCTTNVDVDAEGADERECSEINSGPDENHAYRNDLSKPPFQLPPATRCVDAHATDDGDRWERRKRFCLYILDAAWKRAYHSIRR